MKPGMIFDIFSNDKQTLLYTLTPFYTSGIGDIFCVSESAYGGGRCLAAFVLPVPSAWAAGAYWAQARNTDGTKSNYAAVVVSSWNQLPAGSDSNTNWVDSITILNNHVYSSSTQGKTYTIDMYGWNLKDGAKIVLCSHSRTGWSSFIGCVTETEITTTKLGLGHLQATFTIPKDPALGGYLAYVKNPGGERGYGGSPIDAWLESSNVPDDGQISVSPVSGPVGTTFTFKSDCSYSQPSNLLIVGTGGPGALVVPSKQASKQGSVCGVSLTMSSALQGKLDIGTIWSATISPGLYEVRPATGTGGWSVSDMRIWAIEIT